MPRHLPRVELVAVSEEGAGLIRKHCVSIRVQRRVQQLSTHVVDAKTVSLLCSHGAIIRFGSDLDLELRGSIPCRDEKSRGKQRKQAEVLHDRFNGRACGVYEGAETVTDGGRAQACVGWFARTC